MKSAAVLLVFLAVSAPAFSATIYVPDDYSTIQGAIDASVNGDTVIVRRGTYVENVGFTGKAITVVSEQGATVTTIDGSQMGSVVTFKNGEGPDSVLEGFALINGLGDPYPNMTGGGVTCINYSSPTIVNNTITGNTATYHGGGIFCSNFSFPAIVGNTIEENVAASEGGGIYCQENSSPAITGNTIIENTAKDHGGGISCWYTSSPAITNNIISWNTVDRGGALWCYSSCSPVLTNNTITHNTAVYHGGGICCNGAVLTITNTVFWNNTAATGKELYIGYSSPSTVTISYSDVEGGQASVYMWSGCTLNWGSGMIDVDPLLVDPVENDFHLTWDSQCRDVGVNAAVTEPYDNEGDPRTALGTVDLGADEYYYHLYYAGDVIPSSLIDLKVVGYPTAPVLLFLGSGVADPPYSTQHGDFWLNWPPLWQGNLGLVPADGILGGPVPLPAGWISGSEHPIQALVGPWGGPFTLLTNAEVLVVE